MFNGLIEMDLRAMVVCRMPLRPEENHTGFPEENNQNLQTLPVQSPSARLYGFVFGMVGDHALAESVVLKAWKKNSGAVSAGEEKDREADAVKNLLPEIFTGCQIHAAHERVFEDLHKVPRLQWALQILGGLEPEDRALILMRDQLEWPLDKISRCFGVSGVETGNRLRLARLHFVRHKEVLLNRRKRRR